MKIVVLMAGRGQRFRSAGYSVPKPMIEVDGMSILERTTRSCPYINHRKPQDADHQLYFACLEQHKQFGMEKFLTDIYGSDIKIKWFEHITRGNLDTAYEVTKEFESSGVESNSDLLILDSDNQYNDNDLDDRITSLYRMSTSDKHYMMVSGFQDASGEPKWANVVIDQYKKIEGLPAVVDIREKNKSYVSYPALLGIFYFTSVKIFNQYAKYILRYGEPAAEGFTPEYYMSQVPALYARLGYPVAYHTISDVIPLGTPEDVEKFSALVLLK